MKIKNIKQIKSTVIGLLSIAGAFVYLFGFSGENTTMFFGLLVFGTLMLFAPDKFIDNALRFLKITSKGSTSIEIDDVNEKEIPPDNEN